jgi:hypothetical protein
MKKAKKFDCVQFKEELQARLMREYEGLTEEQIRRRTARKLATSQAPIAKLWRKLVARNKKKDARPVSKGRVGRRPRRVRSLA